MKRLVMVLILAAICCTSIFAFGIGVQAGGAFGTFNGGGAALTFKLDKAPWVFALDAGFGSRFYLGLTADQWFLNKNITGVLNWFVGWGLGAGVYIGQGVNSLAMHAVARLPIGLNMFVAKKIIEPYLQVVPSFGVYVSNGAGFYWTVPVNLGIRFWVK